MWNRHAAVMRCAFALLAAIAGLFPAMVRGHDIPADVKVLAYVKPEGKVLRLLVRLPMAAMREVDFPLRGPGYIDLARADAALATAAKLWVADSVDVFENGVKAGYPVVAAVRISLPSDKSFTSYDTAIAHATGPRLDPALELYWSQQYLDALLEYPIASDAAAFSLEPRVDRLGQRVTTALRFLPPGSAERAFEFHGNPGLVHLDPRWHQAALRFVGSGFLHILEGIDHLLFLLCLVIPFRRVLPLVVIVTSFTVAHSITLGASALGYAPGALWFPPLVEALIATSIVWMAVENIIGATDLERRWIIAFVFGLVHGFGFSFALRDSLQFAGSHLVTSLAAFNVGVELGQLLVLALLVPLLNRLLRRGVVERAGIIILSAFVAHTGWHWMLERGEQLMKFPLPVMDAAAGAALLRWLIAALLLAALVWVARCRVRRWLTGHES